jgi:hypothetical protein
MGRVLAGVAGALLVAPVVSGAGLAVFLALLSARSPDPFEPDGDPCCPRPDSWGATAAWIGVVLVAAFAVTIVACAAYTLLEWARTGRPMRGRRLARIPVGGVGATLLLCVVLLVPSLGDARTWLDCDEVTVTPSSLQTGDTYAAKRLVVRCGIVDGATRAQVRDRLGPPGTVALGGQYWYYDGTLAIGFEGGRVVTSEVVD